MNNRKTAAFIEAVHHIQNIMTSIQKLQDLQNAGLLNDLVDNIPENKEEDHMEGLRGDIDELMMENEKDNEYLDIFTDKELSQAYEGLDEWKDDIYNDIRRGLEG